jgi:RHS repeat-associated protein
VTVDKTGAGAAPDEHVAMLAVATNGTQTRTYPHLDRQGSVFAVSDAGTTTVPPKVVEWRSYTAWGDPTVRDVVGNIVNASPTLMPYGYHGAPHDLATRLVDMRFRVYRPSWGRFVSPDPLGLVDGSNRFAFVGGAVLSYRDPWGLKGDCPGLESSWLGSVGDAVGGAASSAYGFARDEVAAGPSVACKRRPAERRCLSAPSCARRGSDV